MEYGLPPCILLGLDAGRGKRGYFTINHLPTRIDKVWGYILVYHSKSIMKLIVSAITTKIDANTGKIIAPPVSNPSSPPNSGKFATGDRVTATGIWTASSDGSGARGNAKAGVVYKIERVKSGATRPYHLATLGGTWQGWVAASQLRHA